MAKKKTPEVKFQNDKKSSPSLQRMEVAGTSALKSLSILEAKYRAESNLEILPFAKETSYIELASKIIPDRDAMPGNPVIHKLYVVRIKHVVRIGLQALLVKVNEYLELKKRTYPMDILSISGGREESWLYSVAFIRAYTDTSPDFSTIYDFLGEEQEHARTEEDNANRLNFEAIEEIQYTPEEIENHNEKIAKQAALLEACTEEHPFLNSLDEYVMDLKKYDDTKPLMYLLEEKERRTPTLSTYEVFTSIFTEAMIYVTTIERDSYYNVLRKTEKEETFMGIVYNYLVNTFVLDRKTLPPEDVPVLMEKMKKALFALYIVQDLIDDPQITDIKITDPYSIRVRIHGKAYLSDVSFLNDDDYMRFINTLIIRNNIDTSVPEQTFTDDNDERNILRFTITMPYISANRYPVLHIRKIPRKKLLANDLINAGMFDEKIKNYLLDCGQKSTGVVFAGPPGSGKTVCLNWFLEDAYEDSAEILVIQENDELFAYRKGVMFQHVVTNPVDGERPCSLEDLGQLALVAGANVFVIGEAKGGEICSAITLSNSGCRTAMTIHSRSSTETIDKMADLAMRGYATNYDQAKRMLKSFQTIVYLEDFKVKEISEITGYDEDRRDMIYRPIYRRREVS